MQSVLNPNPPNMVSDATDPIPSLPPCIGSFVAIGAGGVASGNKDMESGLGGGDDNGRDGETRRMGGRYLSLVGWTPRYWKPVCYRAHTIIYDCQKAKTS